MSQQDFLESLESYLHIRGIAFNRAALLTFVESCWPLIEDNPDPGLWAVEFIDAGNVAMLA